MYLAGISICSNIPPVISHDAFLTQFSIKTLVKFESSSQVYPPCYLRTLSKFWMMCQFQSPLYSDVGLRECFHGASIKTFVACCVVAYPSPLCHCEYTKTRQRSKKIESARHRLYLKARITRAIIIIRSRTDFTHSCSILPFTRFPS